MAHVVRKVNLGNTAIAQVTITSYTSGIGGEQFTLAEFGLTGSLVNVYFMQTTDIDNQSSLGSICKYVGGGKVMVFDQANPSQEQATNGSLNLTVFVIVAGS